MVVAARYQVRPMTEADIAQVGQIERQSFPPPGPPPPRPALPPLSRRPEPPAPSDYIVGYVGVWLMVDQAHVVAIAVRDAYRRQGVGELLLAEAIDLALSKW